MNLATTAFTAQGNIQLPVVLSAIMFAPGDEVQAKSPMLTFWMTVTTVNNRTGFCRCQFGFSGRDAGNFHHSELKFYGGNQINVALAS
ncbi:hypothetical protein [Pseudomonas sp. MWU12-2323]|uniref:hypothetical protein n=1 Tax=Pseudomonas sp. MWU12-2323 TaxID=2651296 RepID=UPI00128D7536|nr:hypothetical protein [Pseudomonas sp. MWU12-2323]MPQ69468.1 hypothetical protein [Pseudomonas sp. MWU12-2323]